MPTLRIVPALLAILALAATPLAAQEASLLTGTVLNAGTGESVPDAIVRIAGTSVSAVSDESGRFVLRGLPVGTQTLEVRHAALGQHSVSLTVSRPGEQFAVVVRISTVGVAIEVVDATPAAEPPPPAPERSNPFPVTVTEDVALAPPQSPAQRAGTVLPRERILELAGGSQNLGDLIRRAFPALQVREADATAGSQLCLEFRGSSSRSLNSATVGCNDPQIYLDGIPLSSPAQAYSMTSFEGLQWVQAISPGEAGAQFGSSNSGVIVITTVNATRMGALAPGPSFFVRSRRSTFDWDQDPNGHHFFRAFLGAAAGNALALAAGLEVGRRCIYIEDRTSEIETSCARPGVAGVSIVAFTLPALGSALGAHIGGATDVSVGRWVPALIGAGMAIFPGYVYSLTTVGDGVTTTNGVGKAILLVGTPLLTTIADRLYRNLRNP